MLRIIPSQAVENTEKLTEKEKKYREIYRKRKRYRGDIYRERKRYSKMYKIRDILTNLQQKDTEKCRKKKYTEKCTAKKYRRMYRKIYWQICRQKIL